MPGPGAYSNTVIPNPDATSIAAIDHKNPRTFTSQFAATSIEINYNRWAQRRKTPYHQCHSIMPRKLGPKHSPVDLESQSLLSNGIGDVNVLPEMKCLNHHKRCSCVHGSKVRNNLKFAWGFNIMQTQKGNTIHVTDNYIHMNHFCLESSIQLRIIYGK